MSNEIFNRTEGRTLSQIIDSMIETDQAIFDADGEITPELEEQLAKNAEDLSRKVDGYNAAYREEDARAKAIGDEIKRLQALKKTAENSSKRIKDLLKYNMERLGVERVQGNTCKAYFSSSSSVQVDEAVLLKPFFNDVAELQSRLPAWLKSTMEVSKTDLKPVLEKEEIAGASISSTRNLVLK